MRFVHKAFAATMTLGVSAVLAQAPDAGRLLQESAPRPASPAPATPLNIQSAPAASKLEAGGSQVNLTGVTIEGVSAAQAQSLFAKLEPVAGRSFDLAGLRALADRVQTSLRAQGYAFARAYLPVQDFAAGTLRIAVVQGTYGQVRVTGSGAPAAQGWLSPLRPGDPIALGRLERSVLLLDDLPGVDVEAVLRPGSTTGARDLEVKVAEVARVKGEVGFDNHGNRFAGRERVRAALDVNSLAAFGDQLSTRANYSRGGTWLGSLGYSLPIGVEGLRAQVGVSRTDYELGKEFASLGAHGTADVLSAGASYPFIRSRDANLGISAQLQARRLYDERDAAGISERKRAVVIPLTLGGDLRDAGGITFGRAGVRVGNLSLDGALRAQDQNTARAAGSYAKAVVDVTRLQLLSTAWTFSPRLAGQLARDNLDSSEKFVLGGINGVRAYPSGEGTGDDGAFTQLEVRYRTAWAEPYPFFDAGTVRVNHDQFAAGVNKRSIHGGGVGLRAATGPWQADAVLAWRPSGKQPSTEPNAQRPQGWVTVGYLF